MVECLGCEDRFPEEEGIIFDPSQRLIPICKSCAIRIAKRVKEKWGSI